jgi:hypothetical protein
MAHEHKDFSCPACGAEFETREQLDTHARKEHQHAGQAGDAGRGSSNVERNDGSQRKL